MRLNLPSEFFYYTNACNSSEENLLQIRNNFIKALNSSAYRDFCSDGTNCDARFVQLTCGPVSTQRTKRKSKRAVRASSDLAYKVEFVLDTLFEVKEGQTDVSRYQELEAMLYNMVEQLSSDVENGLFDIQGLAVDSRSLYVGFVEFGCPKGSRSKSTTPSCGKSIC
ncbi:hypothetical protein DPMN_187608 [Dreissena polymorpha]|uniref:Uncharacterized protein n=1 Tax=Dreissena polymorpha TaxID=45954 RepID=A0A9D4I7P4_DREPO|nr:hypothetical protein DPMN_187608 [Dreissena polymorpha]